MLLILVSAAGAFGPGRFGLMPTLGPVALVEGAIVPCSQQHGSHHPAYAGGTVAVLRDAWFDPGFGGNVVARQRVEPNGVYRFVLDPGWYELESGPATTTVVLGAGDEVRADLREPCLGAQPVAPAGSG